MKINGKVDNLLSRIAARVIQECPIKHDAVRNILVFVSAVIPKALASMLTSFVIEMAKPCNVRIHSVNNWLFVFTTVV